jgi:hypothetical protein
MSIEYDRFAPFGIFSSAIKVLGKCANPKNGKKVSFFIIITMAAAIINITNIRIKIL